MKRIVHVFFIIFFSCTTIPTENEVIDINQENSLNVSKLSIINSNIGFGYELDESFPYTGKKEVFYDKYSKSLYLLNYEIPKESIQVTLTDPMNNKIDHLFLNEELYQREYMYYDESQQKYFYKEDSPVTIINLYPHAKYFSGKWGVSIVIDNEEKIEKEIFLETEDMNIFFEKDLSRDIFERQQFYPVKKDDVFIVMGGNLEPNKTVEVLIFLSERANESKAYKFDYIPYFRIRTKTDELGKYCLKLRWNNDFPEGHYLIGHMQSDYKDIKLLHGFGYHEYYK